MKLTNRLFNRLLSSKGYTIDQTILIVAIIAILITLVIVTVGWQLINRAGGTRAGAQIKQIEDANGQFFSNQRVWPNTALTTNTATSNMAVLVNPGGITTWATNINQDLLSNLLPGFRVTGTGPTATVSHNMGGGGLITQLPNIMTTISADTRLVIQLAAVPKADAKEADMAIDGVDGYNTGRLIYSDSACLGTSGGNTAVPTTAPTGSNVYVCYGANTI